MCITGALSGAGSRGDGSQGKASHSLWSSQHCLPVSALLLQLSTEMRYCLHFLFSEPLQRSPAGLLRGWMAAHVHARTKRLGSANDENIQSCKSSNQNCLFILLHGFHMKLTAKFMCPDKYAHVRTAIWKILFWSRKPSGKLYVYL